MGSRARTYGWKWLANYWIDTPNWRLWLCLKMTDTQTCGHGRIVRHWALTNSVGSNFQVPQVMDVVGRALSSDYDFGMVFCPGIYQMGWWFSDDRPFTNSFGVWGSTKIRSSFRSPGELAGSCWCVLSLCQRGQGWLGNGKMGVPLKHPF